MGKFRYVGEDALKFEALCFQYASSCTALGKHFHPKALPLFHYTIKSQCLLHIGQQCSQISPSLGWCYAGEDHMRHVKQLVQSS